MGDRWNVPAALMAGAPYATITPQRRARVAEAERLYATGITQAKVAVLMGLRRNAVNELLNDPWREKAARRRRGYQGTCAGCGKPTDGSGGPGRGPEQCAECAAAAQHDNRRWNRDTIREAISRFADIHGRPPLSQEWSGVGGGHLSAVYPFTMNVLAEYGKWADAIEAAGFPRPKRGHKTHGRRQGMSSMKRLYTVLRDLGEGRWEVVAAEKEAYNTMEALNTAMNGSSPEPGVRYSVVPQTHWNPRSLKPVTRFEWTDDD